MKSLFDVSVILLSIIILNSFNHEVQAADVKKPHHHKGKLEPYDIKVPKMELNKAALTKLSKGQSVKSQISNGKGGGRGIVVQDVHAPVDVVMGRILDFSAYPRMVPNVAQCGSYDVQKLRGGDQEIKTRYVLSILGFKLEYFVRHVYRPSIHTMIWTLDYSRTSDLDDSAGYWSVVSLGKTKGSDWSRVFYSVDLLVPDWIPGFVVNILNTQALTSATAWVKTQSEKKFQELLEQKPVVEKGKASNTSKAIELKEAVAQGAAAKYMFGGGDLWETFVNEYSDIIDTKKLVEKVQYKEREEEKRTNQAKFNDAHNVLVCCWTALLFYGLYLAWSTVEEQRRKEIYKAK